MPDITMCKGRNCPLANKCYRYTAEPSKFRQSYFLKEPFEKEGDKVNCQYFWDNKKYEEK